MHIHTYIYIYIYIYRERERERERDSYMYIGLFRSILNVLLYTILNKYNVTYIYIKTSENVYELMNFF